MKVLKNILIVIYFLIAISVSIFFGKNISVSNSLNYLETLTTISAIILGIMGVWLSLIWSIDKEESREENISYVKRSIIFATVVIIGFLLLKLLLPVFLQIPFFVKPNSIKIIRILSYFLCWCFTFIMIVDFFYVIFSFDFFTFDDLLKKKDEEHKDKVKRRFSLTQRENQN